MGRAQGVARDRPLMPTANYVHETRNNERKSIRVGEEGNTV